MKITIGELRSVIVETLEEASMGKIVGDIPKTRGVKLVRVGGLSPVRQKNEDAPESHGVWAFAWPYSEPFLLGSTTPRGVLKRKSDEEIEAMSDDDRERYYEKQANVTRLGQLKREGWRYFVHEGPLYTRLNVPGSTLVENGWHLTDGIALNSYLNSRFPIEQYKETLSMMRQYTDAKLDPEVLMTTRSRPHGTYSKDHFEVFVPRPEEKSFKAKSHRWHGDEEED